MIRPSGGPWSGCRSHGPEAVAKALYVREDLASVPRGGDRLGACGDAGCNDLEVWLLQQIQHSDHQRRALLRPCHGHEEPWVLRDAFKQDPLLVRLQGFHDRGDDDHAVRLCAQRNQIALDDPHDRATLLASPILEQVLHDVRSIGVLAERGQIRADGLHDPAQLHHLASLEEALHDPASVLVSCDLCHRIGYDLVDDELQCLRHNGGDALL
mmetsp:Transcript_100670/g.290872  ORF Transcript_100670/g.290872 Transcript_100670/m.290872 type:complete len:212 (+) Transcript_100670:305-940(+)